MAPTLFFLQPNELNKIPFLHLDYLSRYTIKLKH